MKYSRISVYLLFLVHLPCIAQEGSLSVMLNGSIYQNNFSSQQFGDYILEIPRGNTGIGLSIAYRYYPIQSRISYETGLELGRRNIQISETDLTQSIVGQIYGVRGSYLALPIRVFYGARPAMRKDRTRSSGLYAGLEFVYWSIDDGDFRDGPARAILEEERQRIRPFFLVGIKTSGGVINSSMEFSFPIFLRSSSIGLGGDTFSYQFRELIWQISMGHSF